MATEPAGPALEQSATLSPLEPNDRNNINPKMDKHLRKKGKFEIQPRPSGGRLQLLDLPLDVLKEIIAEINHTNDLTALALTHSALHGLVVPQMYSRFDIVWPEAASASEPRVGVDALAYGLSTLVMSEALFGADKPSASHPCEGCGHLKSKAPEQSQERKVRKGNNYAQYTRKFSLGNGPFNMVEEYLISKESGKMLGTLVALAVARMENLETFVWDMPTGIVRDVWDALASLGGRKDGNEPRLESIWIRLHDSKLVRGPSDYTHAQPRDQPHQVGHLVSALLTGHGHFGPVVQLPEATLKLPSANVESIRASYRQTEHPNFSTLPPLKSITALDIDQIAYYEELSVLIERSIDCLRELRIGVASAEKDPKDVPVESHDTIQIENESGLSHAGAGGILGMLFSKFHDCRRRRLRAASHSGPISDSAIKPSLSVVPIPIMANGTSGNEAPSRVSSPPTAISTSSRVQITDDPQGKSGLEPASESSNPQADQHASLVSAPQAHPPIPRVQSPEKIRIKRRKLKLQTLELERVSLSVTVLQRTLEWKHLTSITLLFCNSDEDLWKTLRRSLAPKSNMASPSYRPSSPSHDYPLKLKRIHTNGVTPSLVSFLKENLAPNTLECMFLQDRANYTGSGKVTMDMIYRGPLRRHRTSLQKVSIDSGDKQYLGRAPASWKRWIVKREALAFITSGKMSSLRELALNLDYNDWHFFLQNLPNIPHLRSLYIPHIKDYVSLHPDPKEIAMQVLDIVTLRPEIEICYMGIFHKCFEILEGEQPEDQRLANPPTPHDTHWNGHIHGMGESDSDDDDDDEDGDGMEDSDDGYSMGGNGDDEDEDEDGDSEAEDGDNVSEGTASECDEGPRKNQLKLREILFYTEKVEIFKVRHATL